MREELRTIGSKGRHVFTATFVRFGFRNGYIGPVKTMLLQDVTLDSKIVSYDMAFAAFVVDNMRKQNMLKEDKIAELLKDNPNEK